SSRRLRRTDWIALTSIRKWVCALADLLLFHTTGSLGRIPSNRLPAGIIQGPDRRISVQRLGFMERGAPPIPLGLIFLGAFLIHAPLLLMKLPLKSYDTNFHIFFASHYSHHWFDPWNAKW